MFRFEKLEIWQRSVEVADKLFDMADDLEVRKLFRFAEQLRGAGLSAPNNIAEGSGSTSNKEFKNFLNIARRSTFENANMLIIFARRKLIDGEQRDQLLPQLDELCRMITAFSRSLDSKLYALRSPLSALRSPLSALMSEVLIRCENVSKKFCRDLKKNL